MRLRSTTSMVALIVFLTGVGSMLGAQTLSFEVASIKPTGEDTVPAQRMQLQPGGRFNANNVSLKVLMKMAYGLFPPWPGPKSPVTRQIGMGVPANYTVDENEIAGGAKWMETDRFDVIAKSENEASPEQIQQMLQTLLADRFQLKIHHETRDVPQLVLTVAKGGLKLKEIPDDGAGEGGINLGRVAEGTTIRARKSYLSTFNKALRDVLGKPIVDRTGLTGFYDITLVWTPEPGERIFVAGGPAADNAAPSIFTAMQEQLGLRLEATKGPGDVIVIDSAEKPAQR